MNSALLPVAGLVGVWRGHGKGVYPTIDSFQYDDELTFADVGKPFLAFGQRTWIGVEPRHVETGYWRFPSGQAVESTIAIPTGQVELGVGYRRVHPDGSVELVTDARISNTPTAKRVDRVTRKLRFWDGVLTYEVHMAAVGQPLQLHLSSALERVS